MAEFASRGVANTGLGLGIAGTALGLLSNGNGNGGLLGGLLGNRGNCYDDCYVNRYELNQENTIAQLKSEIALRDANTFTDSKIIDVYKYFNGEINAIKQEQSDKWAAQGVINTQINSGLVSLNDQVKSIGQTLSEITKVVVPANAVCAVCATDNSCCCNSSNI